MLVGSVTSRLPVNQQDLDKTKSQQDDVSGSGLATPKDPGAELEAGKCQPDLMAKPILKIKEILEMAALHETFWRNRLRAYQSIQLPYETVLGQHSTQWTTSAWCERPPYGENDLRHTVLTAFAIYLARLTGQVQLQIGWRLQKEQDEVKSPSILASTVPMQLDLAWDESFSDALEQIKEELKQITQRNVFARDLVSRDPALREISELQAPQPWRIGISMVDDTADEQAIGAVLTLQIDARGHFRWLYNRQLLDAEAVDRMSGHLQEIVKAAQRSYQNPVKQLNLLPEAERRLLLKTWNATKAPYPDRICLHRLFEKQVEYTPDATALVYEDQALSYTELNVRANRFAHRLIELGVGPDICVAICVKRSPAMVVGLLAILKAGGAYVPLDPAYPSERLTYILADAVPTILLADMAGRTALGKAIPSSITVLDLNDLPETAITNPQVSKLRSDHLAYMIYTSGSTGMPKGVMMEHRAIVNLIAAPVACFGAHSSSRILQVASLNFDVSIWEIFIALHCGASLYLPPDIVRYDRNELWRYLARYEITHAILPPALLQNGENLPNLDRPLTFVLTGEASSATLLQNLTRHGVVFNAYGPTETHAVTVWPTELHRLNSGMVSIGRPIANTQLYLLDAHGQPVPLGAFGELYIGGAGVARGYLNRPELTAERFLLDPFSEKKGARMYKTGDLARYMSDGNLEFLGRNDHQIKIRGFRVEPGEIEARLIEHPQVREAAVLALGEGNDKRLVAYVVAEADEQLASMLHAHLAAKLPDFMIPTAFVQLDGLPLTSNRKLDRRALPVPSDEAFARQAYEAPQGEIEKLLAAIWAELLNIKQISRNDSFFSLGGHSLLAIQMIERLRHYGLTVSIRALFDTPTLRVLAQSLGQHRTVATPPNLITADTTTLTPAMLPLIDLSQAEINQIIEQTPEGVSNIQDIYALAPLQEGILFHHLLAVERNPYLLIEEMVFDNRALLNRYLEALQQVVNRHDILRTAFIWEGLSTPAQVVWRHATLPIEKLTLDPAAEPIVEQLRHHRFDLTQAPLLRCAIAQESDGRWRLVQLLSHLVSDHSTLERLSIEIQAFLQDRGDTLPAAQSFRNLVAQVRLGVNQETHERFFREMLAQVDEPTLPFGLVEVHRNGTQVGEAHRMLPQDLSDRLRVQAKLLGVSLASLCHLAWAQILARTSSQQRVVFGTVLFGRMQAGEGADHAFGLFNNTLPLCINLDHSSIQDSVRHTQTKLAALLEHEHASLALAQRCSGVPAGTPLFSALLNYVHNTTRLSESLTEPGIEFVSGQERTNYPLALAVEDDGHALSLMAQVVESHDPVRICSYMQQTLQSLVEALERTPDMPVNQLEVLPSTERELLLNTWSVTKQDYPEHQCVHQLFEVQVERAPDAIALVHEDRALSYAELNAQANRLAHSLIKLGVGPDTCVGLCVKRSPAWIVGLLAILKAGGAYVPLDPGYPSERLVQILADAAPKILLADATGRRVLGDATLASHTVLDPNTPPSLRNTNPSVSGLTPRHLAYVVYTSGSTGTPKGVMVEHRGVVNLVQVEKTSFDVRPSSRILQFVSPGFDASTWEIVMALGCGAALYLPPEAARLDRHKMWDYLEKNAITHATIPPALLQDGKDLPNLTVPVTLFLIGEALNATLLRAVRHHGLVFNGYGPTEATIGATVWPSPSDFDGEIVPIGRPMANIRLYLLDAHLQPVPLGAIGELYIGGVAVARGYLNRPELTAERFLTDPFNAEEDARMYKTGDLARYLPDGNLEFIGRNDHQIKMRGLRIEPGEIEARLVEHPQVRETAVLAVGEGSHKRLVAYVVADADEQLAHKLRAHLSGRLPEYMIPPVFVRMNAFPLTPNGKVDRHALPVPSEEDFARQAYEAPQGEIEIALATIWAELLKVEKVSRRDNFFALGGHSLLAVRLMNRIKSLGVELPLAVLFSLPSLSSFATAVHERLSQIETALPAITPVSREGLLPLSFAQQRLWFLAQLDGVSDTYHIPLALHLRGMLDRSAWQRALNTLFARHEALRSVFVTVDGQPQIELLPPEAGLHMHWHNLRQNPNATEQLERLSIEEAHAPFDLAKGPLIRARLLQLADDKHILLLNQHHIVSDGWSLGVLLRELNALYTAYCAGQPDPLPPLEIQYPDYAAWQRQWLSEEKLHEQSAYWRTTLADTPVLHSLPTDRPRPPQQSFAGAQVPIQLNAQMTRALKRLSQQHGVTLFTTLLAAWATVLSRLSGQEDLIIGTPTANRNHPQLESLIGFFVNTLALRIDLSGAPNTLELIRRVQHSTLAAQAHQDLPFEQVVEIIQPPRRLDHTPLFQVMFAWQNNDVSGWQLPDLEATLSAPSYDIVKFDLELELQEMGDEICGDLRYATALFERETIERQVGYLYAILQAMVTDAEQSLFAVSILSHTERKLLLQTWNATAAPYPKHQCIHQLFEGQVERTPQATALVYEDQAFSYAELNVQANRLAHQLIELGVQPGSCVVIYAERSPTMIVGLLAILKAGGAYVPLDPKYPPERLMDIVLDSAPVALLSIGAPHAAVKQSLDASVPVLDLQADAAQWQYHSNRNPEPRKLGLNTEHLAYIIYTSGSTGKPKGVMARHEGVVNLVKAMAQQMELGPQDRVLQFASFSFDASVEEIFPTLTCGATLVLRTDAWLTGAQQFWSLCATNRMSVLGLPTQFWAQLTQEKLPIPNNIRLVKIAGDALSASAHHTWFANAGHRPRLLNVYGPTEATVSATVYEVAAAGGHWRAIGRPIANARAYILDSSMQPMPLGAVGELYIGGVGVTRGYLNRPELTSERFLHDPFSDDEKARMYKTGDMARYLPDGNLEFLGRNDHQIKLRGFRVEPGEIEARLVEHPQVREAAVLAVGEGNDKRLVAYVAAQADEQLVQALRAHLAAKLPDYMTPTAFVRLDVLPLTSNGKLDRRALPMPSDEALARQAYEAPQGEIEIALATIWHELLKVEKVSRHDNFFALGGHSLLVVQMIERLRRLDLAVSVRALFDKPTLKALAQSLGQQHSQHHVVVIPPNLIKADTAALTPAMLPLIDLSQDDIDQVIEQTPGGVSNIQDIYALSPLQEGILFHHLLATKGDPYLTIAQMTFANRELLNRYLHAVQQVVNRHDILRTAFVWNKLSTPAQVVLRHASLSITELSLNAAEGPIAEQLNQRFDPRHHRLDLTQPPLFRFVIARDSDGRWQLIELLHHLIGDHSTIEGMHNEIQAFLEGRGDLLPPPQPFRNLVSQARLGISQEAHEHFFKEMLAEVDEPTLPFGLAEVHRDGTKVTESHRMLPQDLNDRLRAQAKRLSVSLASLCHLAWAQILARTSGQRQVVFGTVLFGRMQAGEGADHALGLFINTLPLRIDINERSVQQGIRHVQTQLAGLLEHEHASLVLAQRCSGVPAGAPLFSALLNYRHNTMPIENFMTPGIEFLGAQERTNYPLTLSVEDEGHALGLTAHVVAPYDSARLCAYMQQTLQSLVVALEHAPDTPLCQLDVLPPVERELLLNTWNATKQDYPKQQGAHQLFEAQVECTPDAPALVYEDQVLSYAELNAQANRLAHRLIELGLGPDKRVAVCVERSPAMVVGLLAVLKAAGVYVPLDPAYSSERLTHILTDAAPTILLADAVGRTALGEAAVASLTVLDPSALPQSAIINPVGLEHRSDHVAYVIYTSGSTGMPKGVMVEHQGVLNLAQAQQAYFEIDSSSRVLQFASPSFDASIWEIIVALSCGASLALLPDTARHDLNKLWNYLDRYAITHATLPPALLQDGKNLSRLKTPLTMILAGEAPSATLLKNLTLHHVVINAYGPTEATVCATAWRCPPNFNEEVVPIGRPISNTQLYVLDANGQPVPIGAVGELYIGGAGVARGYLNRPELTAERFLPDPFSEEKNARMYKTGDMARYLPDGNLEFLGRNDHQIKLRGFRIEPGEIEARLIEHPQVREASVLAVGEGDDKRLVAYVVAETDEQLAATLLAHLIDKLPEYMVPAAFVRLDALPLTPNGKLDRRALPTPDGEAFARQAYEAPQGEIETALATIWSELLKVERVSRHDSFFALGGHSLLAVQMIERLRRLDLTVSVRALFDKPTLKALAQSLGQHQEVITPPSLITTDTTALIPAMLPLIDLSQAEIDRIIEQTPGGVANIQDIYALSPLQDGILFHHLMATEGDPYLLISHMIFADRELLNRYLHAVQQVVNRHDILRTAFVWDKLSTPAQVVWRHAPLSITELSLAIVDGPIAEQLNQRFDPRHHRFDLTQAPLLRFVIAQDSDGRWQLIELLHHLIGDHSTLEEMQREIEAFLKDRGDLLPPPQPFRNLVAQARLGMSQEEHERFFKEMLAEVDEPTLPFGLAEVHRDGTQVTESHQMLPQELNDRLRAQARRLNVSLASLCHLAWAQVLARTSGQQRVVFGTVLFGRMQAGEGADRALGLFINTLPLRIDVDHRSVQEGVRDTQTRLAALLEHEHASLALAQRCGGVPAGTPLFSALLNYRHNGMQDGIQTKLDAELLRAEERDNYPIGLSVEDFGQALGLTAQIVKPFDSERVCGYMHQALQSLVEALEHAPNMPVCQLEVLPPSERELLLNTWNATAAPYPEDQCLHQLFEAQVERTPEAIALVRDNQTVSYAELNAQANRLAHHLRALGVQPDSRVALYAQPSIEVVIGMLAVTKLGGAYVPLDPNYPPERLVDMVIDSAPVVLLSIGAPHASVVQCLSADFPILDLRADAAQWEHHSSCNLDPHESVLNARHLAYVIYTSGSTGRPKGVMVEHRSVVNYVSAAAELLGFGPQDRMLQFASLSFDASVEEVFLTLTQGAALVLRTDAWLAGAEQFWALCEANQISVMDLPTQFWTQLAQEQAAIAQSVRVIFVGGDALSAAARQAWFSGTGYRPRLLNGYGPTEATIATTVHEMTAGDNHWRTIGRPLANTRAYVLDSSMQLAPVGVEGELYIGGVGVARGYWNRPELTPERFMPDTFSDQANARMYKTGDLVRYLPNGNLEFLGRNDHQVKIRGFRIELSEIELHLAEHPQVREAIVLALSEGSDKRLVAYVVAEADEQLASTLRSHLATRLPEYMMPAAFVRLDALPLTPSGKLDRRALPVPSDEAFARQTYEAPQGVIETTLANIWSELLGLEQVSRHDNFFTLGGHSLLAVRMISRIRSTLGIELTLRTLFETPTVEGLVQRLMQQNSIPDDSFDVLFPIQPAGTRPPLFCVHPVLGISWSYSGLSQYLGKQQPIYGLQARGIGGAAPLALSIDAMAADYLEQIRCVQPDGPYHLLGWSFGGCVAHSMATQLEQQGEKVALLALMDSYPDISRIRHAEIDEDDDFISILNFYSVEGMADTGEYLWEKTRDVIKNNGRILERFAPLIYRGNVLFFRAAMTEDRSAGSPDWWKPYALGDIETHDIDCEHVEMDRPEPIAEIGRVLAHKLEELQKG